MKQISEVEGKPFTSSVNICPEAYSRKGLGAGWVTPPPPPTPPFSQLIRGQGVTKRCNLFWLANSALIYEPKCGGLQGLKPLVFKSEPVFKIIRFNFTVVPTELTFLRVDSKSQLFPWIQSRLIESALSRISLFWIQALLCIWSPNKLRRSISIFNQHVYVRGYSFKDDAGSLYGWNPACALLLRMRTPWAEPSSSKTV